VAFLAIPALLAGTILVTSIAGDLSAGPSAPIEPWIGTDNGTEPYRFTAVNVVAAPSPVNADAPVNSEDSSPDPGEELSEEELRSNIECIRSNGFDLPDPTVTEDGWWVVLDEPLPDTDEWRQAVFVDCRLMDVGSDLVLGGRSASEIDELIACTREHGVDLPTPTQDGDHFVFPLDPDEPKADDWYVTIFVTCRPQS
jgi:hypothetical protein